MLQAEQPVKALLPHGQSYEESQLRELLFIEMFIKRFPLALIQICTPGDGLSERKGGLLTLIVSCRLFKIQQILHVFFHQNRSEGFRGPLIAAVRAIHRFRDIQAAKLLHRMVADSIYKGVVPRVCKRPKNGWNIRTYCMAFWPWRSLFSRALEFSQHTRVSNFRNIEVIDSRSSHFPAP
jgi:hypothetical protein